TNEGVTASFQLKSDSFLHTHAQTTKTYYKHQDLRIKKDQVLKTKTFVNSDIKDNSLETKLQGRLSESFQDDANYEHVGQDKRSQGYRHKERLKSARDDQKSYADNLRKPLEFSVDDKVYSRCCLGKAWYVSKCLADVNLHVPLEEVKIDDKLHFVKEPMEIMDSEVKKLKRSRISIVKVRWNSRRGLEFTWEREDKMKRKFVTLVKQSQELKTIFYHKLYDILKQHQNEVNEIRAKKLAHIANPLALVSQQQPVYHPQNHPNHYTQNSLTKSPQDATRNRGKAIVNSFPPTYNQEPKMFAEDDALSKEKEIDKLMTLISLSFKKIYKPTNNNLKTSSYTSRAHQDNTPRINRGTGYDNQRTMLLCKQEEAEFQLNAEQANWRDDTDDEPNDREIEAHYMYMAQIQEVTPDVADNSGPIFDTKPFQKEKGDTNITIDSLDMSTNEEMVDQDDDDLTKECDLLASLIEKLKCKINESKNSNKFLESTNKTLVDKLKDLKKFQAELDRCHNVNYASKVEIYYAKAKGDLMSYKIESQKSLNEYTQKLNKLNQTISEMKKELYAHQETISIMSQ
nr:hypothetical protein [Tanacetum cinerariifolium]